MKYKGLDAGEILAGSQLKACGYFYRLFYRDENTCFFFYISENYYLEILEKEKVIAKIKIIDELELDTAVVLEYQRGMLNTKNFKK